MLVFQHTDCLFHFLKLEGNLITQTSGASDGIRWAPPEMLMDSILSAKSDIYSFGMTILEVRPDVL